MTEHEAKVMRNKYRANTYSTICNTPDATRQWLQGMGTTFCDVWFYTRARNWTLELQVEDHDTFLECVGMAMSRLGAGYALWYDGTLGGYLLKRNFGKIRTYPNREAAEMVAIHNA